MNGTKQKLTSLNRDDSTFLIARTTSKRLLLYWFAACIVVVPLSVMKGTNTYYDFLNIKWAMGWNLSNGNFNLKGLASTRLWAPPFLDIWNSVLSSVGVWWLPAVLHGAIHALIFPLIVLLATTAFPQVPELVGVVLGVFALATPLTWMQVGTTTGHLHATIPIIVSLTVLINLRPTLDLVATKGTLADLRSADLNKCARALMHAGGVFALAPILKPSVLALVPAHLLGFLLLTGSVGSTLVFLVGFSRMYLALAVSWSLIVVLRTDNSLSDLQSPGVPVHGAALLLTLPLIWLLSFVLQRIDDRYLRRTLRLGSGHLLLVAAVIASASAWLAARDLRIRAYDYRWFVSNVESLFERIMHTGDLQYGFLTVDLESAYFDPSIPMSFVTCLCAVGLVLISNRGATIPRLQVVSGLGVFVGFGFFYNAWATGYTRYASQLVPLVGVASASMFALASKRWLRTFGTVIVVCLVSIPLWFTSRASAGIPRFGQVAYDEPVLEDLVSKDEAQWLSDLIPQNANVILVGELISYVVPVVGRQDVEWWFFRPKGDDLNRMEDEVIFLYAPDESDQLDEFDDQPVRPTGCQVLRFDQVSIGYCEELRIEN